MWPDLYYTTYGSYHRQTKVYLQKWRQVRWTVLMYYCIGLWT